MHWLQILDVELFRFVNSTLSNRFFDQVMPFASGNALFLPALVLGGILLLWKGGARGRLCLLMIALILPVGEALVTNTIKHAVGRERPFMVLADVHCLVGMGGSGSLPSAHAANWFAATLIALVYYRRSMWFMLPCALIVSFSRVYNGVHYPSDVMAGAILGAGYAAAGLWALDSLWMWAGRKWFPLWWEKLPSLTAPARRATPQTSDEQETAIAVPATRGIAPAGFVSPQISIDAHWLRLSYVWIAALLVARWGYLAGRTIQLAEDEAYQWLWSKHLALSYYSKPPLIALVQFLGTALWGDTAFGVRFFSPLIAAIVSLILLRFFAREVNARAGFFLLLICNATPLLAAGAVLMTVDPLSVLFWTAAMVAGWRAVQEKATTRDWLWVGLWMGLGFLSKYTALFQWLCWAVFFALRPPARKQLRRPGPYLALVINLICALPVLIWNYQHDWITVAHLADDAGFHQPWQPTLRPLIDFVGSEAALLNPVFFVAIIWACVGFWRRGRQNPRLAFFFSMGVPLFLVYLLHSVRSRVLPNWIAPAVIPLLCLAVIYWDTRWRLGETRVKSWLITGLVLGFSFVLVGHNTNVVEKVTHHYLPVRLDPLHRVREWNTTAQTVGQARATLLTEGKPAFIITEHYGLAGEISFYLPEAKTEVQKEPLVYFLTSATPQNQFFFWPGYTNRIGQNAVFVRELDRDDPTPKPPPAGLEAEFASVTEMGVSNVWYHDRFLLRPLQFFACRGLK